MLPGSSCGDDSICFSDECVPKSKIDPMFLKQTHDEETLDLSDYCSSGKGPIALSESNQDLKMPLQCIDWENDVLCKDEIPCPSEEQEDHQALYMNHVCCKKCSPTRDQVATIIHGDASFQTSSILLIIISMPFSFIFSITIDL